MKRKSVFLLISLILISVAVYLVSQRASSSNALPVLTPTPSQVEATPLLTDTTTPLPPTPVLLNETPVKGYDHYFEKLPTVNGQQGYVSFPLTYNAESLPPIVMYYHGSGQRITSNFSDQVMKNMRAYGAYFTSKGYAFLASNQHGDNQGNKVAVEDSEALIKWVKERYDTADSLFVIGFSMGGKPAMRHVLLHPTKVERLALLAPAQQIETYTAEQIKLFKNTETKVWHGTADVNVPYWVTEELQAYFKKYSVPLQIVTLKGKTHWDVDTEYMKDIEVWFSEEVRL